MYFRTNNHEYRNIRGCWQMRRLGTSTWRNVQKRFWNKLKELRKSILRNARPKLADNVTIRLNSNYDEQTKKTTPYAYKYGVDLESLVTK